MTSDVLVFQDHRARGTASEQGRGREAAAGTEKGEEMEENFPRCCQEEWVLFSGGDFQDFESKIDELKTTMDHRSSKVHRLQERERERERERDRER